MANSSPSSSPSSSSSSSNKRRSPHIVPSLSRADTVNSSSSELPDRDSGSELGTHASSSTSTELNLDVSIRPSLAHPRGGSNSRSDSRSLKPAVHTRSKIGLDSISHTSFQTLSEHRIPEIADYAPLQGERPLGQRSHIESSQAYDKQVLSKIGGPTSPSRSSSSIPSAKDDSTSSEDFVQSFSSQAVPLSLPERHLSLNKLHKWKGSSTIPGSLTAGLSSLQNSNQISNMGPPQRSANTVDDGIRSNASNQDQTAFNDGGFRFDDSVLNDSRSPERSPRSDTQSQSSSAGQKRRAMSPPAEILDPNLRSTQNTHQRNPLLPNPPSPQDMRPGKGKVPSSPANLTPLNSANVVAHPATFPVYSATGGSFPSEGNTSTWPTGQLPEHPANAMTMSQPVSAKVANPPPIYIGQDANRAAPPMPHRRQESSGMTRPGGLYICECCPKKPKKFESEEDLRAHEAEKQYVCQYCHNRFKNKNEAERHQNSLHLRRHSWSCAALTRIESAFHPTPNSNAAAAAAAATTTPHSTAYPAQATTDTCGYCGQEFPNPADWNVRMEHLSHAHKFGECNQGKKFFRADHFRQHLKHSHAGTSGRWTNQLETACMREEPPPQPVQQVGMPVATAGDAGQVIQPVPAAPAGPSSHNAASAAMANMVPSSVTLPPKKPDDPRADGR